MKRVAYVLILVMVCLSSTAVAEEKTSGDESRLTAETFSGLELRGIGPALMSGRISDIAMDPNDRSVWYVAVSSGNVWKTVNCGTTWTPIFDHYGSYSIGCITIDPNDSLVLWLGTGENNSQRSTGYGDGVYKSLDGGKSWQNMGLKNSEHIGKILVDPRDSNVVYVASQGPLWAPGGDRGLYKTTDGGENWELVLEIGENTGVSDIAFDPRNPDVIYATSYQRRRHVWALVAGGPEAAIYKSYDGGKNWKKIVKGLPGTDLGRIGIAVSPQKPDVLYATVPASWGESGFFRSSDGGENWVRMNDYMTTDPQYYQELFCDPHQFDRVYCMDVWVNYTEDGGKTFKPLNSRNKHVDNHAMVFDPQDPEYMMIGCDGGIYESWDRGATWRFIDNLPVTQFYRVGVDNDFPFYNVHGGTQDNDSQSGPSRTNNMHGIRNADWFITTGGDGYQTRVDPTDPNVIYSESQYGGLVRYDRKSGEEVDIQPQPGKGEPPLRWNWDTPLLISPHSHTRLYFAANRLFRSDDRGDTWTAISPDLNRGIDRNKLEVMGKVWSSESVWKNVWTSFYGNSVALDESPLVEGLIYVGTDDGLVQVTEDGGENWRTIESFPGIPELTYVADLTASQHDPDTVYAVFNNHKRGDFKPYVLKSSDRGRTWTSISANLPDRHVMWCIVEDHVKPELLFAGSEFGLFFTIDGGGRWIQLRGGAPVIAFRDLEIQKRENDLACATFGRGYFILDDYTPLRQISEDALAQESILFPVKKAWVYSEAGPLGWGEKASQGDAYFTAPNPPFGAVFTYYLSDGYKTLRQQRKEAEAKLQKEGKPVFYPSWEDIKTEDREDAPTIVLTVKDEAGNVVRRIEGPANQGLHRVAWNLRYPSTYPTRAPGGPGFFGPGPSGPLAVPGTYSVSMSLYHNGVLTPMGEPQTFVTESLGLATLPEADRAELLAFQQKTAELWRAVSAADEIIDDVAGRLDHIERAILDTPAADTSLLKRTRDLELQLLDIRETMRGNESIDKRFEPIPPAIRDRVQRVIRGFWSSHIAATTTYKRNFDIAAEEFEELLVKLKTLVEVDLKQLEADLEAADAPWTPGRAIPDWKK
ncbi:MAG TPA: glycosyl hydrolase [Acidobacteriota bacterium]|nr:glycosyl hydrolase [Acidobacteriota bacterium]